MVLGFVYWGRSLCLRCWAKILIIVALAVLGLNRGEALAVSAKQLAQSLCSGTVLCSNCNVFRIVYLSRANGL